MAKELKLNLDQLNVESFVTNDEKKVQGGYTTRPWTWYEQVCSEACTNRYVNCR